MLPADGRAVVVGASLAGLRAAEALRREGHTGPLTIVGAETHWPPFDRPPLSKRVLAGTIDPERTRLRVADTLGGADLRLGVTAAALDHRAREVRLDDGSGVPFDGLVVATGARVRSLPGSDGIAGVFTLRTYDDCVALRSALDTATTVAVVGAGFIGSEVASTCAELGKHVTVVEALDQPLVRILGGEMGRFAAGLHRAHGVDLRLGVGVDGFVTTTGDAGERERVRGVRLTDGTTVDADVVVVGIGVVPNTGWLDGSGLAIDDGVVCDERCRALTTDGRPDPAVVAAGDVARWHHGRLGRSIRVEHWTNAVEQAAHAARALLHGDDAPPFEPVPYFWSDQFGTKLQFLGVAPPDAEPIVAEGSVADGKFVAAYGEGGVTLGALCVSWPARMAPWQQRIAAGEPFPPSLTA